MKILDTAAATEALDVALRATISPGDIVAVESPVAIASGLVPGIRGRSGWSRLL